MNSTSKQLNEPIQSTDSIDIRDLFTILWNKKFFIASFSLITTLLMMVYSLSIPNTYTSFALLTPTDSQSSASSLYSSPLASLAGISIQNDAGDPSIEAIERIQSYDFFTNHFLPNINFENLVAIDEWIYAKNTIIYDETLFDNKKGMWKSNVSIPSKQDAYYEYKDILSISEDKNTKFVNISIQHQSPHVAKKWVNIIINNINESMRERDKKIASEYIEFLNAKSQKTNFNQIKDAISQLLEAQMQKLMLASANKNYIYNIIEFPIAPEKKSGPSRTFMTLLGLIFGIFSSIVIVLARKFWN